MPYVETISTKEIGYDGPWCGIAQDKTKALCFVNKNGVVVFDGASWNLLETSVTPAIYSDKRGTIYIGTSNQIQTISVSDKGEKKLIPFFSDSTKTIGRIAELSVLNNEIYCIAENSLYVIQNKEFKKIELPFVPRKLMQDRNTLYVASDNALFDVLQTDVPIFNGNVRVNDAVRTRDAWVLVTENGLATISPDKSLKFLTTEIDSVLRSGQFSCLTKTVEDYICIGTKSQGQFCIDTDGSLIFSLNAKNGFADNKIDGLFADKNGNVWVTTDRGILRIEMNTAITYFNENNGLQGRVMKIFRLNGNLEVGTDRGLFSWHDTLFWQINNVSTGETRMYSLKSHSFINYKAQFRHNKIMMYEQLSMSKDTILVFGKDFNTSWFHEEHENTFVILQELDVTTVAKFVGIDSLLFLGTQSNGVWLLLNKDGNWKEMFPCDWQGLPKDEKHIDVYETSSGVLFSTSQGLYRCDVAKKNFYKDEKIPLSQFQSETVVCPISEDEDGNLLFAVHTKGISESQLAVAWNTGETYTLVTAPFFKVHQQNTQVIYPEKGGIVWLGGTDGLVRVDFNKLSSRKTLEDVVVQRIIINGDSVVSRNYNGILSLPYTLKSITFDFISPEYENRDKILYSCYLEGLEEEMNQFSIWENKKTKEYADLPAGKYVFHVIARRTDGASSKETTFEFEVRQHPLLSGWAFAFYIIIIVAIILGITKLRRSRFDREHEIVEKLIDDRIKNMQAENFKEKFAENQGNFLSNKEITSKLALSRFEDFKDRMFSMYEQKLPKKYYYHNLNHMKDVVEQVENIGRAEGINDEDMHILKTAALLHDAGFMQTYKDHEHAGMELARQMLPNEGYSQEQIDRICRLIECTILTEEPQNLLERIIRDADLDYLGRDDYFPISQELYKELLEMNLIKENDFEWCQGQITFLQEHTYYTDYSRKVRNPVKVKHIQCLQEQITKFNNI
ncbi:MAG: HD domain-containing protein [Bacteroidales bacterium]|nr:HD domain-containing protein [Bacteroidales bacterium]